MAGTTFLPCEVADAPRRGQKLGYTRISAVELAFQAALAFPLEFHGEAELRWRGLELDSGLSPPAD
jgi:hypothetical protein